MVAHISIVYTVAACEGTMLRDHFFRLLAQARVAFRSGSDLTCVFLPRLQRQERLPVASKDRQSSSRASPQELWVVRERGSRLYSQYTAIPLGGQNVVAWRADNTKPARWPHPSGSSLETMSSVPTCTSRQGSVELSNKQRLRRTALFVYCVYNYCYTMLTKSIRGDQNNNS